MLPVQLPVPLNGCNCRTSCFLLLLMAVEMDETNLIGPQMHVRSTEKMRAAGQPPAPECFAFHSGPVGHVSWAAKSQGDQQSHMEPFELNQPCTGVDKEKGLSVCMALRVSFTNTFYIFLH